MLTGLASSYDGRFVAFFDSGDDPVEIWTIDTHQMVAKVQTILDAGGSRLAMSREGRVVAGAYRRHGAALYEPGSSTCLWQQRSVTKVQQVKFEASGVRVWCVSEQGPAQRLEIEKGSVVQELRGARWICLHHGRDVGVSFDGRKYRLMDEQAAVLMTSLEAPPLAGAFADTAFCVSEVGGPLRCVELSTRSEVNRVMPRRGCHWTGIGFIESAQALALIRYPFEVSGSLALELFDLNSGQIHEVSQLPSLKYVFCDRGALLLGSHGDLRRTSDGELIYHVGWFVPSGRGE